MKAKLVYDDLRGNRKVLRKTEGDLEEVKRFEEKYLKFTRYREVHILIE